MASPNFRIAIVGAGQVGGATAYAMILRSIATELLLVDIDSAKRDAQVSDLSDATYISNSGTRVRAATHHEAGQCDIIIITAGAKNFLAEISILHMYRHIGMIRNVVQAMSPFKSDSILLIVANPVDLLTQIAQEVSRLPTAQVIGSGTFLDSVRLRGLLADKAGVAAKSIDIHVLGAQGDSQVVAWSTATVGGIPIAQSIPPSTIDQKELERQTKDRTKDIVRAKQATTFGISSIVTSICSSIRHDTRNVRPISHFQPEFGCCFSSLVVLGRKGITREINMSFESEEQAAILRSANELKETMDRVHENYQD
ncbi:uncharacterized protein TRUGW13939_04860 [Talaromyces rugulosus]|uniref:L-lactate dehydrogenase n=1 Tax=Talaromyces rugulosus TaxID=121627 RepID=A0A7H8QUQ9_TALRU|nr:uncharacterized protein TRUGW13939_04860 [Talaromyces rugulosus]QKX57740.1 hypothetical protein TRUGW13939_04860 [Talaromyces rugulosus]